MTETIAQKITAANIPSQEKFTDFLEGSKAKLSAGDIKTIGGVLEKMHREFSELPANEQKRYIAPRLGLNRPLLTALYKVEQGIRESKNTPSFKLDASISPAVVAKKEALQKEKVEKEEVVAAETKKSGGSKKVTPPLTPEQKALNGATTKANAIITRLDKSQKIVAAVKTNKSFIDKNSKDGSTQRTLAASALLRAQESLVPITDYKTDIEDAIKGKDLGALKAIIAADPAQASTLKEHEDSIKAQGVVIADITNPIHKRINTAAAAVSAIKRQSNIDYFQNSMQNGLLGEFGTATGGATDFGKSVTNAGYFTTGLGAKAWDLTKELNEKYPLVTKILSGVAGFIAVKSIMDRFVSKTTGIIGFAAGILSFAIAVGAGLFGGSALFSSFFQSKSTNVAQGAKSALKHAVTPDPQHTATTILLQKHKGGTPNKFADASPAVRKVIDPTIAAMIKNVDNSALAAGFQGTSHALLLNTLRLTKTIKQNGNKTLLPKELCVVNDNDNKFTCNTLPNSTKTQGGNVLSLVLYKDSIGRVHADVLDQSQKKEFDPTILAQ